MTTVVFKVSLVHWRNKTIFPDIFILWPLWSVFIQGYFYFMATLHWFRGVFGALTIAEWSVQVFAFYGHCGLSIFGALT